MLAHHLNILVVCNLHALCYRVLFCLYDAGVRNIYVLANNRNSLLRYSRFCKRIFLTETEFDGRETEQAICEINRHIKELGIDTVIPGDQQSTRLLTLIQSQLDTECFPLPDATSYDTLYNKWEFGRICHEHAILYPESMLLSDARELMEKIISKTITYPAICKPVGLEASKGIVTLTEANAMQEARNLPYKPILVQQFIAGEDIGISIYCEQGIIRNYIAHTYRRQFYRTFYNEEILNALAKIMTELKVSGVFNFDMRLTSEGKIYFLECNPRFFFKMIMSALAGVNFVAAGLGLPTKCHVKPGTGIRLPCSFVLALFTKPHSLSRTDIANISRLAADPVPFADKLFRLNLFDKEPAITSKLQV